MNKELIKRLSWGYEAESETYLDTITSLNRLNLAELSDKTKERLKVKLESIQNELLEVLNKLN